MKDGFEWRCGGIQPITAAEMIPAAIGGFEALPLKGGIARTIRFDCLTGASDSTGCLVMVDWEGSEGVGQWPSWLQGLTGRAGCPKL